ncbi:Uu.00g084970.m01.CDS01 [Anthostomella pinea]|uniref:Uu.00g084970.m01.CDS01 n=1 Tax=Anthostomella pinea TaxID=933095 RepID=A0AAI8VLU1_9PEZI|nr:Uu.00g084970.m01.CDS01 [Anthostomella pinea]
MLPGHPVTASGHRGGSRQPRVTLVRDHQSCIPLTRILGDGDIVVLLTPVVAPSHPKAADGSDPFEPLGRALAAKHPWIRHVPYTARNGMTSTHVSFIKRAKTAIFVISGPPAAGQSSQVEIAHKARMAGDQRPQIVVACRDIQDLGLVEADFSTVVQLPGYSPADLQAAAALLLGEAEPAGTSGMNMRELIMAPKFWPPENWDGLDVTPIQGLWNQCLPEQFRLDKFPLQSILQRDGYAMHFVVRLPETREMVGFCATYTTFVDKAGERLIGSLALIIVKPSYRRRGIGLSLYEHALKQLKRTRGVDRVQLGSTFPRLLSGIPAGFASEEWFKRRGWQMDRQAPGHGQDICDWLLSIDDWPSGGFSTVAGGLLFRQGTFDDFDSISRFIEKETTRKDHTGWYDQYMNLAQDGRLNDIVLGLEHSDIVAAALVYTPHEGSSLALDLPWSRSIGPDVGGVTCICISGQFAHKCTIR